MNRFPNVNDNSQTSRKNHLMSKINSHISRKNSRLSRIIPNVNNKFLLTQFNFNFSIINPISSLSHMPVHGKRTLKKNKNILLECMVFIAKINVIMKILHRKHYNMGKHRCHNRAPRINFRHNFSNAVRSIEMPGFKPVYTLS